MGTQFAPLSLANTLGQLLNGTVVQTNPSGPLAPAPQYAIQPTSGTDPRNAGLMAQLLATENPVLAQQRIAAEEAYLRNPPQFSLGPSQLDALKAQLARATTDQDRMLIQRNIDRLLGLPPQPPPQPAAPVQNPSFAPGPAPGGFQATPGPSFTPQQVGGALAQFQPPPAPPQPQPQPQAAPPPAPAPTPPPAPAPSNAGQSTMGQGLNLADLGALLSGIMGPTTDAGQINLQNPATYSPGAGMSQFQPLQSLFSSQAYQRSQPAALFNYLGRGRGY